jgi:hypothetical protein
MSDWHDSFDNGNYFHRILEISYDSSKTFGKSYYWFNFNAVNNRIAFQTPSGWDTVNNVPIGTLWLDYTATATNTDSGYRTFLASLSTASDISITRYTSAVDNNLSWFLLRNNTIYQCFLIAPPSHQVAPWIDLNKNTFSHLITPYCTTASLAAGIAFTANTVGIRRSYGYGAALHNDVNARGMVYNTAAYAVPGRGSNSVIPNCGSSGPYSFNYQSPAINALAIMLPNALSAANPAYTSDYAPVVTGVPYSFYMTNAVLPSDMGIVPHYANNTLAELDRFIVTAGVEEWEVLAEANSSTITTGASIALAARVV